MSRFQVLPPYEAKQFDEPPKFNQSERKEYFVVGSAIENIISRNTNPETKIGAVLLYGYFMATNKFFGDDHYRKSDVHFGVATPFVSKFTV